MTFAPLLPQSVTDAIPSPIALVIVVDTSDPLPRSPEVVLRTRTALATLVASGLVGASLLLAPTAFAATDPIPLTPTCAEALRVYFDAHATFAALPATVPNPALPGLSKKIDKAQSAVDTLQGKLNTATTTATATGTGLLSSDLNIAKIEQLTKDFPVGNSAHPIAQEQIRLIRSVLTAQADLASAQAALADAVKARQDAPAVVANPKLTKGAELDAVTQAQTAADKACQGQPGNPGPVPTPATTTTTTVTEPAPAAALVPGSNPGPLYSSGLSSTGDSVLPSAPAETGGYVSE